ncbi:MAG: hypothetical protein ACMUIG_05035 [Thermoplasmatota archaeon]
MTAKNTTKMIILSTALIGAIFLAGIGFLGILVELSRMAEIGPEEPDIEKEFIHVDEFDETKITAEDRFDESMDHARIAEMGAPSEMKMPIDGAFTGPSVPSADGEESSRTRSDDDLTAETGYISKNDIPKKPQVSVDSSISLLNGDGDILRDTGSYLSKEEIPESVGGIDFGESEEMPVTESGVSIDETKLEGVDEGLDDLEDDLDEALGENAPSVENAGLTEAGLSGTLWEISNKTTIDGDLDGNPEWIYDIRFGTGQINNSAVNGTLSYAVGFERKYEDADSDGNPNYEEITIIRYANYTINGIIIAEGVEYSHILRNDTDSDGTIDRIEIRHLSYGYHYTILKHRRSFARGGEVIMDDTNGDGTFDKAEGTAIVFFRHEAGIPLVPVVEAARIVHGETDGTSAEWGDLAFIRVNNTKGETQLEMGFIRAAKVSPGYANVMAIGARNDTVNDVLEYAILNATRTVSSGNETLHVTAFAVRNSTIEGGARSDALAIDWEGYSNRKDTHARGFLAAARNDTVGNATTEVFVVIMSEKDLSGSVLISENTTVILGVNVTSDSGLNSTIGLAQKLYEDGDGDGSPEYLREALAVGRTVDSDIDGNNEKEGYWGLIKETYDSDSDGNPETVTSLAFMGWKWDSDDDGNVDLERGLLINVTSYDNNSNGNVELRQTGTVGFQKTDSDSDGVIDHEKYLILWKTRRDVYDDGTQIEEESGSAVHES